MAMKDVEIFVHVAGTLTVPVAVTYSNVDAIIHSAALEIVKDDDTREVWPALSDFAYAVLRPVGVTPPGLASTEGSRKVTVNIVLTWGAAGVVSLIGPQVDDVQYEGSFIVVIDGERTYVVNPLIIKAPILVEPA